MKKFYLQVTDEHREAALQVKPQLPPAASKDSDSQLSGEAKPNPKPLMPGNARICCATKKPVQAGQAGREKRPREREKNDKRQKELTEEQKQEIKEAFDLFDTDGSGSVCDIFRGDAYLFYSPGLHRHLPLRALLLVRRRLGRLAED